MKRTRLAARATLLAALFVQWPAAHADIVDWGRAFALQGSGVNLNQGILVGFNPQPEPPGALSLLDLQNPTTAQIMIDADPGAQFTLYFGAYAGIDPTPFQFDAGGDPNESGEFSFMALSDAGALLFELQITSESGGVPTPGTWVGFNPQPEPPAVNLFGGAGRGQGFMFEMTSLSTVTLTLRVFEEGAGEYVAFEQIANPVPLPGGLALLPGALAVIGFVSQRRRAAADRGSQHPED